MQKFNIVGENMPIYRFKCEECCYEFAVIRKISEIDAEAFCENCSSSTTNKLITSSSFVLKGNGWYKDGYSVGSK
jgi:putative FmdB family regulatory protein